VPVDAYPAGAGPTGAEQLAGNVWEWVSDESPDGWGVVRGGSYLDTEHGLHVARALPADPERATGTTGFRIVFDRDARRSGWTGSS
jgi:formylglycine-generating enzyme required for sulfatase activity